MVAQEGTSDSQNNRPTFGAASSPLYVLAPDANAGACHDQLLARLGQLTSMLQETYGNWREQFESKTDEKRDDYMWACYTLAQECEDLARALPYSASAPLRRDSR